MSSSLETFRARLFEEWLPAFCEDPKRNLDPRGFTSTFAGLAERDATDFMRALDAGVVYDDGGGRYLAARKSAYESLFNHGLRTVTPRPITLSLEPIITVAALGRLHLDYGWPKELLGLQPAKWEFDFAAYVSPTAQSEYVAGETKKSTREVSTLLANLRDPNDKNSHNKLVGLQRRRAPYFWVVGPDMQSSLFAVAYSPEGELSLAEVGLETLHELAKEAVTVAGEV